MSNRVTVTVQAALLSTSTDDHDAAWWSKAGSVNHDMTLDTRYRILPAPLAATFAAGGVYCWSMYTTPLMHAVGVVAQAPMDWTQV